MNSGLKQYVEALEREFPCPQPLSSMMDFNRSLASIRTKSLPCKEREILSCVPILLLPTREANALAGQHGGASFIALNAGLLVFLEAFRLLFLDELLLQSPEQIITRDKAEALVTALSMLFGDPANVEGSAEDLQQQLHRIDEARQEHLPANRHKTAIVFEASLATWFLGHEYGHIAKGHMGSHRKAIKLANSTRAIEAIQRNHDDEYEADEYGLRFMTQGVDARYGKQDLFSLFLLASADICTSLIRLIEYAMQIADHWTRRYFEDGFGTKFAVYADKYMKACRLSHPPARLRNERIRALDAADSNKSILAFVGNVQFIVERTMRMMHENQVSLEPLRSIVLSNIDALPDDVMARAYDMDA